MKTRVLVENCKVISSPISEGVRSILIEGGKIERLSDSPTQSVQGEVLRLDAHECTVSPGLVDTHCHLFQQGASRRVLDLRGTTSITSIRLRLHSRVGRATRGEWIFGRGWDQETLSDGRFPTRQDIDDLTPNNPTLLTRVCGHVGLLNSPAVEALAVGESAPTRPELVERDSQGMLTGIVREGALESVQTKIPRQSLTTTQEDLLTAEYEAAKNGITTIHCILSDNFGQELQVLRSAYEQGRLSLRYRIYAPSGSLEPMERGELGTFPQTKMLSLNGVKLFADGSLGARTAALSQPYSDDPSAKGVLRYTSEGLVSVLSRIGALGIQAAVHAIGDAAVSQTLEAFEEVEGKDYGRRWRIEHASLTNQDIRRRMKEQDGCVTVQPHFVISDLWVGRRLGRERLKDLYTFKSFVDEGLKVSGSSDAPVEPLSPLLSIWAAMVRSGYGEEERLSLNEGLALYTSNAAYLSFDEDSLGRIEEGLAADLTIFDSDINEMHPAILRRVNIANTIVNGELVYSSEGIT